MLRVLINGVDAIKLLENEGFDLMLSDNAMTKVKGFDLIKSLDALEKKIKSDGGWVKRSEPIIIVLLGALRFTQPTMLVE